MDEEEYDYEGEAALPAYGAQDAQYSAPASSGAPAFIPYHPSMNAQQRRMIDMMNSRRMNEYRQEQYTSRSQANQRAIMERQEAGRNFRAQQSEIGRNARVERDDAREASRQRFEALRTDRQIEADDRREAMRIRAEQRKDPNFVRQEELAQLDAAEGAGISASRGRLLGQVRGQQPTGYAGALPIGMQGQGGFQNPATAMQMPEQATGASNTEEALDLTMGREFAASLGDKAQAAAARDKSNEETDLIGRAADQKRLGATARSVDTPKGYVANADERIERFLKAEKGEDGSPGSSLIDRVINEGIEEEKSKKVDTALIPQVKPERKRRMAELMADLTKYNDKTSEEVARAVYNMTMNMGESPRVMMTSNGALVQTGDMRLVFDEDQWRKLMVLRGQRQKEYDAAKQTVKDRKTKQDKEETAQIVQGRQDVDDQDRLVDRLGISDPRKAEAAAALRATSNRANEFRRRRQEMGLE